MVESKAKIIIDENKDNIKKWLADGMTMLSIAKALGVSKTTLYKYLNEEDLNAIKSGRAVCVDNLENIMYTSATGFERKVKKNVKLKRCTYENGKKSEEWEEMVEVEETQYFPPDTTAGIFLLKNWANYKNEPAAMEIRQKELELKEKQVEAAMW